LRGGRIVLAHGRDAADVAFVTDYGALELRSMAVLVHDGFGTTALNLEPLRAAG
jgi:hypothetical protein